LRWNQKKILHFFYYLPLNLLKLDKQQKGAEAMSDFDLEYQKTLCDTETIAVYLKNAAKRNDESYLRHCQATADKALAHLLAKEKEV
jgi:hypothetical protein